jgi:hypothetical protein
MSRSCKQEQIGALVADVRTYVRVRPYRGGVPYRTYRTPQSAGLTVHRTYTVPYIPYINLRPPTQCTIPLMLHA